MKRMLDSVDLVIECRDYRLPLTSRNPLFEESLAGLPRMIVFTKKDLAVGRKKDGSHIQKQNLLRDWYAPAEVVFMSKKHRRGAKRILELVQHHHENSAGSLTGSKMLIVGMPNVGKSSLLNELRYQGTGKGRVSRVGAQPGITRKIETNVKIIEDDGVRGGLYMVDTPGVFMPYVPDSEAMLKLALCGCVKDNILPSTILADYLLYHLNLEDPALYEAYHPPTNDVLSLLDQVARKTGMLQKGGVPNIDHVALWFVQRWRAGNLGCFVLDEVTEEAYKRYQLQRKYAVGSLNQAKKAEKEDRKSRHTTEDRLTA
ncbi:MAG: Mitochondrial GTPase [Peltula sp. TS41687]|nr:MAG: Mitochondrial GTPase [Peltula sp. TS41687]